MKLKFDILYIKIIYEPIIEYKSNFILFMNKSINQIMYKIVL